MTDTITPASLRAHAEHMERVHLDGISAKEMRQEAARLEAESARDEEAEKLAEVYRVAFKSAAGDSYIADGSWAVAGVRAVLDQLAADGRLLPESGELTEAVKASLTDALDTVLSAAGVSLPVPDSGPDGTPEKPWPTAADVPDGTWFRTAKLPDAKYRWLRCGKGSTDYADMADPKTTALGFQVWDVSAVNDFAPFVRVDGDKA